MEALLFLKKVKQKGGRSVYISENKITARAEEKEKRKMNKQEMMEACIIAQAGKILKRYEDILSVMNCESRIRVKNGKYLIDFLTGFERVHAEVDQRGKCEIWLVER